MVAGFIPERDMEMRRQDRLVDDPDELQSILKECKVCRIATIDEEGLYIVPMNFGYEYDGERLALYVHSARDGRKVRAFRNRAPIAFEMDTGHELVEGNIACQTSYRYKSIIGNGDIQEVTDNAGKSKALNAMMQHLTGKAFQFNDKMMNAVAVFRINVSRFSGKKRM